MSGNSHQRHVTERAVASALNKVGITSPLVTDAKASVPAVAAKMDRNSFEAYTFFVISTGYAITSAFGLSVNFWAGLGMSLFAAAAAIDLLWRSFYTFNWNKWAKSAATVLIVFIALIVVNQGYVHTHHLQNPNAETLSAIQNLSNLVGKLQPSSDVRQNTVIVDPDGRYPEIELGEPREFKNPDGTPLLNVDETNEGSATAKDEMSTAGIFIAPLGSKQEDAIFHYLYKHEHDQDVDIPHGDVPPRHSEIIPITGPVKRSDGSDVNDTDRMALYNQTQVLYSALLISYQDVHGHIYHKELCYFTTNARALIKKCNGHNGHG
jgi:hypothetical protein